MKKMYYLNGGHLLLTICLSYIDTLIVPGQMVSAINKLTPNGLIVRGDLIDLFVDELTIFVLTSPSLPDEGRAQMFLKSGGDIQALSSGSYMD